MSGTDGAGPTDIDPTGYFLWRVTLRGFDLRRLDEILRHGAERYLDRETGRYVVVGRHDRRRLVAIVYEVEPRRMRPVTVHATTREQVSYRCSMGRYTVE